MSASLVIQQPATAAQQLILLFHGVGASAESMAPVGHALARRLPQAWVVCVQAPDASDFGSGWQWFSVQGVTETNRPARVAAAQPAFAAAVQHWQTHSGVDAAHTTLVGFSQGAIMALEATQQPVALAGQVVALAGRFAQPPRQVPAGGARVHLIHGEQDPVIPVAGSVEAARQLQALGHAATLDLVPGLGHGIDTDALGRLLNWVISPKLGGA